MTSHNARKTFRKMDDEELPNFSIDFDFLNNVYFCEDVPDDILISLEETWCDNVAAADKENRKQTHDEAKPTDCNATSSSNNKTPRKSKADITEIIKNTGGRKTGEVIF